MALPTKYFDDSELIDELGGDFEDEQKISRAKNRVIDFIEEFCNTSFLERTKTEKISGNDKPYITLSKGPIRELVSVKIEGVSYGLDQFDYDPDSQLIQFLDVGEYSARLRASQGNFPQGFRNIEVTYKYGDLKEDPDIADNWLVWPEIADVAIELCRQLLLPKDDLPLGRSVNSLSTDQGTMQFQKIDRDHPTGIYWVDEILTRKRRDQVIEPAVI